MCWFGGWKDGKGARIVCEGCECKGKGGGEDRAGEIEMEIIGSGENPGYEGGRSVGRRGADGAGEGGMDVLIIGRMCAAGLGKACVVDAMATREEEPLGFGGLANLVANVIPR